MTILLIAAIAITALYFIYKKFRPYKKPEHPKVLDPNAQQTYELQKNPDANEKALSLEERIELSWEFLTRIAEQILGKFSSEDQAKIEEIGHRLNKAGMRYVHDVNLEVSIVKAHSKHTKKEQAKAESQSMSQVKQ